MTYLWMVLGLAALAVSFWMPCVRRLTFGDLPDGVRRRGLVLKWITLLATGFWCVIAIKTGARLDYNHYLAQWRIVLDGRLAPWGPHTSNAYGPLYNLLALPAWIDPFLPKLLFVLAWAGASAFLIGRALRRGGTPYLPWLIAAVMLASPFFAILVAHYGYFDILPAVLCLAAVHLRLRGRDGWSGAALASAVLLKFYPLAMLPFVMLDGRRLRWKLGAWCIGLVGLGMLVSFVVWGDSTLHPLAFAGDRPSKLLSVFRFLRGPYSPLALFMEDPNADHLSLPTMILLGGGVWLACRRGRVQAVAVVPACIAGLATGLQLYKVGHVQFQMPVVLLIVYWAANGGLWTPGRRAAVIAATVYLLWLTGFVLVYALLRRVSRDQWLVSIRDYTGLVGFAMTLWLVTASMLAGRHPTEHSPPGGHTAGELVV